MKQTILQNGLAVITESVPSSRAAMLAYVVRAGSHNELEVPAGTAHFLEHMLFKGTPSRTSKKINEEIAMTGGYLNAYTSAEITKYYAHVPAKEWRAAAEILSDVFWNPQLPQKEMAKERGVILEEFSMYDDEPAGYSGDLLHQLMNKGRKERLSVIGTTKSVKSIKRSDLAFFLDSYYGADNSFFVATGNINHDEVVAFLESFPVSRLSGPAKKAPEFTPELLRGSRISKKREIGQLHLSWGCFAPCESDSDAAAMDAAASILGASGNSSSRLYEAVREELGLSYAVSVNYDSMTDAGHLTGYVGTDPKNAKQVEEIIVSSCQRLAFELVPQEELDRAIKCAVGSIALALDDIGALNDFIANAHFFGSSCDPDFYVAQLEAVTPEDVMRVAQKYFDKRNFYFALVKPK